MSHAHEPFGYCINTSTIKGQNLSLENAAALAVKAGYQGIEPWISELDAYVSEGGCLEDLGKRFADLGLSVENAIGFFAWDTDDDARRRAALEEARRCLDIAQRIGCKRLAAPPMGMRDTPGLDLDKAAERYRTLLEIGEQYGVQPMLEFWGFSKSLSRFSEALYVAIESGHPNACILADIYHLYKGGSGFHGLRLVGGEAMGLFHVSDYPAFPSREKLTDAHRVYPGDGVAPWTQILSCLKTAGYCGMLSVELFNEEYWKQDAFSVIQTALAKLRRVVQESLA